MVVKSKDIDLVLFVAFLQLLTKAPSGMRPKVSILKWETDCPWLILMAGEEEISDQLVS